jgi:short subunit dehydrogenase-like uncharacterized protein
MPDAAEREHDVVIFGATGFTGALTAEYLAENAPEGVRWALAGRNRGKLEAVRERLAELNPAATDVPVLHADVEEPATLREVARSAHVVATTVGPYMAYGEPLVEACAQAGTDYADLTGEPEFVDRMYVRHDAAARESGARIVHTCGFDSIPPDLGALFTVQQLPEGVPLRVQGFVRAGGTFSGGTYNTALASMGRLRQSAAAASERRKLEPKPEGRRVRAVRGAPRYESAVRAWVLPMPTIDPAVVTRSARALDRYGPDFTYSHWVAVRRLPVAAGMAGGAAAFVAIAQLPPARALLSRVRSPGEGPSAEQRAKGWFKVRFVGEGGGRRVVTEVAGGDPGYGDTAKMLGEAALCLAGDELPETAGQVTPAVAMGDALRDRLENRAGQTFTVLEAS